MFGDDVLELIEPIAAGEATPEARLTAHVASCDDCRAALEDARRVETLLRARPAAAAPPNFTVRTMSRLRRERWRREQAVEVSSSVPVYLGATVLRATALGISWWAERDVA